MNLAHTASCLQLKYFQLYRKTQSVAHGIGNPCVALAVDRHSLAAVTACRQHFNLARITCRKARRRVAHRIGDPNPILLIDGEVKGPAQLAWTVLVGLSIGRL